MFSTIVFSYITNTNQNNGTKTDKIFNGQFAQPP